MMQTVKIAVAQATCGHLTCVGPNDFEADEHSSQMDAAIGWHLEAGYMPAATYWIEAVLPALPEIETIQGTCLPPPTTPARDGHSPA